MVKMQVSPSGSSWIKTESYWAIVSCARKRKQQWPRRKCWLPAAENEVTAFIALLKKTSRLTDDELKIIAERFSKNNQ
jgi:hypothetical protein